MPSLPAEQLSGMPAASRSFGAVAQQGPSPTYAHTAHRYNSWSAGGRRASLWIAVVLTATMCAYSLVAGAWPVVLFAVFELAVLYGALAYVEIHADDCERVTIRAGMLALETRDGGRTTVREFNRYWVRVAYDGATRQVTLRAHAEQLQLGRYICPEDREAWHAEVARALR